VSSADDFRTLAENQWCPGCPNFGILAALRNAVSGLGLRPSDLCLVSGIGQAAKLPHYLKAHFFNGLHGRALPVATAVKAVNPALTVIVTTGDGDCYGEGGNHFIHAVRRNPDVTLIVHDNRIYGLTKGQASPTTELGDRTRLQFDGVESVPFLPLATALVNGGGFVARGYAGNIAQLSGLFGAAVRHRGFALVDVIQPCITWGTQSVEETEARLASLPDGYDPADRRAALELCADRGGTLYIGILYQDPASRPCFGDRHHGRSTVPAGEAGFPDPAAVARRLERYRGIE
jgi:2-oxoglutarate/2-oxoacid ferredoxin oxidoreductase subunit beta